MPTRGKNNINIWLPVIISILIGQLQNIFKSKQPKSSSVFGCSVNWPDWNVTIIFRFFQRCFKSQPKRCFNADGKYIFRDYQMLSFMNINSKERKNTANSTLTRRHTRSQKTSGSLLLNWKSSYDVMLFMCQSRQQHFTEF